MSLGPIKRIVLHKMLLKNQGRTIEHCKEHFGHDGGGLNLHNTSIEQVIAIVDDLLDGYDLVEVEEDDE